MISILMACHNRIRKTVACIESVLRSMPDQVSWNLVLADDGCTDGTVKAVKEIVGDRLHRVQGTGDWYWSGGMLAAWRHALTLDPAPEAVLWLNDDVELNPDGLRGLFELRNVSRTIVGTVADPSDPKRFTYGGRMNGPWWNRLKTVLVEPGEDLIDCDTCNGNVVLVERETWEKHGLLDPVFKHAMADLDYGWRLRKGGADLVLAPGILGTCEANDGLARCQMGLSAMLGPKMLPMRSWFAMTRRWAGPLWPLVFLIPYAKAILRLPRHTHDGDQSD